MQNMSNFDTPKIFSNYEYAHAHKILKLMWSGKITKRVNKYNLLSIHSNVFWLSMCHKRLIHTTMVMFPTSLYSFKASPNKTK